MLQHSAAYILGGRVKAVAGRLVVHGEAERGLGDDELAALLDRASELCSRP